MESTERLTEWYNAWTYCRLCLWYLWQKISPCLGVWCSLLRQCRLVWSLQASCRGHLDLSSPDGGILRSGVSTELQQQLDHFLQTFWSWWTLDCADSILNCFRLGPPSPWWRSGCPCSFQASLESLRHRQKNGSLESSLTCFLQRASSIHLW